MLELTIKPKTKTSLPQIETFFVANRPAKGSGTMFPKVRSLMVPGRSVPAFILHEDYTTWGEMLTMLIGNMVRNGLVALTLVVHRSAAPFAHQMVVLLCVHQKGNSIKRFLEVSALKGINKPRANTDSS